MAEIILSYVLGRESWGDPVVVLRVDNLVSLRPVRAKKYENFLSFKSNEEQTPFQLLDSVKKYISEKVNEEPSFRIGPSEMDLRVINDPDKQYGSGIQYGPDAMWPKIGESVEEAEKREADIKRRNSSLNEILLPVFTGFVKEKGLVQLIR